MGARNETQVLWKRSMCSLPIASSLQPPNNTCHPVKLTEEMYHIHVVPLDSPCPTSLGVLCKKVCPFNNNIQQSVEVTSAARLLPAWAIFSPWMRLESLCTHVSDFLEYWTVVSLDVSETLQLVLHLLTSLSCLIQPELKGGDVVSSILSHKHHSRTGEPVASTIEQAAGHGANEDLLSFI